MPTISQKINAFLKKANISFMKVLPWIWGQRLLSEKYFTNTTNNNYKSDHIYWNISLQNRANKIPIIYKKEFHNVMEFENFQSVQESKNYSDTGMYVDFSKFNDVAHFVVFLLKPFNSLARN